MTIKASNLTGEQRAIKRKNGITVINFYNRVNQGGWSIEDAITIKPKKVSIETITVSDLTDEQRAIKRKNGVSSRAFYSRVNTYGWSIEDAISYKLHEKNRRKSLNFTEEEIKKMESNGIRPQEALRRINLGWNREDAINVPVKKNYRYIAYKNEEEVASGKDYEVAEALDMRLNTVLYRASEACKKRFKKPKLEIDRYTLKEWEEMHEI